MLQLLIKHVCIEVFMQIRQALTKTAIEKRREALENLIAKLSAHEKQGELCACLMDLSSRIDRVSDTKWAALLTYLSNEVEKLALNTANQKTSSDSENSRHHFFARHNDDEFTNSHEEDNALSSTNTPISSPLVSPRND